jgi:Carboxypeptidase regulatory-like domain
MNKDNDKNNNGDGWLGNLFIDIAIVRHLLTIKTLMVLIIIVLALATWGRGCTPYLELSGEINDQDTHLPISAVSVTLLDAAGNTLKTVETDKRGVFIFQIQKTAEYQLELNKKGYKSRILRETYSTDDNNSPIRMRITLTAI